jgi:hypothetical protein
MVHVPRGILFHMSSSPPADREALEREALHLERVAAAAGQRYARTSWLRFVGVFFPVPFVVVLMRYELSAWHYCLAGVAYVVFALALFSWDTRLSEKRDRALAAAERARLKCENMATR